MGKSALLLLDRNYNPYVIFAFFCRILLDMSKMSVQKGEGM